MTPCFSKRGLSGSTLASMGVIIAFTTLRTLALAHFNGHILTHRRELS